MAPKKETPDAPKTKRVMTPDQLEKLAQARVKAAEVRQALKDGREDTQLTVLQAKMDKIKSKKTQPKDPEPIPEEPPEMTSVPTPDEETDPDKEEKIVKPEPQCKVEPVCEAGIPIEKMKKKTKKKVIVMPSSDTSDSEDDSNVIFVKKTSRKKKEVPVPPPQPPPPAPKVQYNRPPSNPFFAWNSGLAQRNFM